MKVQMIKALVLFFALAPVFALTQEADARVGGGRSSGRSFSAPRRSAPPPSQSQPSNNSYNSGYNRNATPPPAAPQGGFMRGLAGGLAGGFLGSMLFSSLGHGGIGGLSGGGGGGGMGLLEIILIGALIFLGYRYFRSRQKPAYSPDDSYQRNAFESNAQTHWQPRPQQIEPVSTAGIDPDVASDLFFKIQGAWTRRDLASVRPNLGPEIQQGLEHDLAELRKNQQINRLENITVRSTEVTSAWVEGNVEYATVRFTANLLDYTVDERTNQVVQGSDHTPTKFQEFWTFAREGAFGAWRLMGIEQE